MQDNCIQERSITSDKQEHARNRDPVEQTVKVNDNINCTAVGTAPEDRTIATGSQSCLKHPPIGLSVKTEPIV